MGVNLENISIERANLTHVDGILKLAEANSPERGGELTGRLPREEVAATIQMSPAVVAVSKGLVVGFLLTWEKSFATTPCAVTMLAAYSGSEDAFVHGPVCVDASLRGRGVAGAMFNELRKLIPGREGILFIKASNEASIRAHIKMGVHQTAEYIYNDNPFIIFAYR